MRKITFKFLFVLFITVAVTATAQSFTNLTSPPLDIENFHIKPNPVNSYFTVNLPEGLSPVNFEVYNVLGQLIEKQTITRSQTKFDTSQWKSGVYLAKLVSGNNSVTKRLVKN